MARHSISIIFVLLSLNTSIRAQHRAGIIDVYGLQQLKKETLIDALGIKEGDSLTVSATTLTKRLLAVKGVKKAEVSFVCCDGGKELVYVGISENNGPEIKYRRIRGSLHRLPDTLTKLHNQFFAALKVAVTKGDHADEFINGYSLYKNPEVGAIQKKFLLLADFYRKELKLVLNHSTDQEQRAIAAVFIAYMSDKRQVAEQLNAAGNDPDPLVRNNVFRAFAALGAYAFEHPELQIRLKYDYFVSLLNSIYWSDRDKALFALIPITQNLDPKLLASLKKGGIGALAEMSQWRGREHAIMACILLGRIQGWTDDQSFESWKNNDGKLLEKLHF
ncbi:MAG: hypothetical protein REI78_06275 [Pedobacter sp.]|nr:hypothetical protein [Pedobacter sp.]MDQ8052611.1 hypothetical protein [Pedobacter sp.]